MNPDNEQFFVLDGPDGERTVIPMRKRRTGQAGVLINARQKHYEPVGDRRKRRAAKGSR